MLSAWSLPLRWKLQDQEIGLFTEDWGCVSVWCWCCALGMVAHQELSFWFFHTHGVQTCDYPWPLNGWLLGRRTRLPASMRSQEVCVPIGAGKFEWEYKRGAFLGRCYQGRGRMIKVQCLLHLISWEKSNILLLMWKMFYFFKINKWISFTYSLGTFQNATLHWCPR